MHAGVELDLYKNVFLWLVFSCDSSYGALFFNILLR